MKKRITAGEARGLAVAIIAVAAVAIATCWSRGMFSTANESVTVSTVPMQRDEGASEMCDELSDSAEMTVSDGCEIRNRRMRRNDRLSGAPEVNRHRRFLDEPVDEYER